MTSSLYKRSPQLAWSGILALLMSTSTPSGADPNTGFVQFQDPLERAFTMDVPAGWIVQGGLFRLGFDDFRPMVDMHSPDGETNVRMGDVSIPNYTVPVQYHMVEGQPYDLGAQAVMTVARYRSGKDYAALYARARFRSVCQELTPIRNDLPPPVESKPSGQGSEGQISLRCGSGRGSTIAYVFARTEITGNIWKPSMLASFVAPEDRVAAVREMLLHCSRSLKISEEWQRHQQQMSQMGLEYQRARQQGRLQALNQQVQQFERKMQGMKNQVRAFQSGQNAQAGQVTGFTNVLAGITPTYDPLTGQNHQTWTGPKSGYWINGKGERVNSDVSPGPGWRRLEQ